MCAVSPKNTCTSATAGDHRTRNPFAGLIVRIFRPMFHLNLVAFRLEMGTEFFPPGPATGEVGALEQSRLLFIGDCAASGYGVLNHGLGVVSQTARFVAREHDTGVSWSTISDVSMTMTRASFEVETITTAVDAVVILLGPPDVLKATTRTEWETGLRRTIDTVRELNNAQCPVVVAAIPPMDRFRSMPKILQRLLRLQIARLDATSLAVSEALPGVCFAPFPDLTASTDSIKDPLSWKTVHSQWALRLGEVTARALTSPRAGNNLS